MDVAIVLTYAHLTFTLTPYVVQLTLRPNFCLKFTHALGCRKIHDARGYAVLLQWTCSCSPGRGQGNHLWREIRDDEAFGPDETLPGDL